MLDNVSVTYLKEIGCLVAILSGNDLRLVTVPFEATQEAVCIQVADVQL